MITHWRRHQTPGSPGPTADPAGRWSVRCRSALWCPGGKSLVVLGHQGERGGVCGRPEQVDVQKVPILVLALPPTGRVLWAGRRRCPSLLLRQTGAGFAGGRQEVDGRTFGPASRS